MDKLNELDYYLKSLKLSSIGANIDKILSSHDNLDFKQVLVKLLELEYQRRHEVAIATKLRNAKFPKVKTIDDYDFTAMENINKRKIIELTNCQFIEERKNIVFIGSCGTGKTHLATALGVCACGKNKSVYFIKAATLANQLIEAGDEKKLSILKKKLDKYDLIILDEMGYIPLNKEGAELLYDLISDSATRSRGQELFSLSSLERKPHMLLCEPTQLNKVALGTKYKSNTRGRNRERTSLPISVMLG